MKTTMEIWQDAQIKELEWHKENQWRADTAAFMAQTNAYFDRMGFNPNDYKSVIDAGCGPRLRGRFFKAEIYAIDPLANEYLKAFAWCDLDPRMTYSVPLEDFIPDLRAEFLFSLNCLDHCRDFEKAVGNIAEYADTFFLSYDCGDPEPDPLHPLILDEAVSESVFKCNQLKVMKKTKSDPWRAGYALNYWLAK